MGIWCCVHVFSRLWVGQDCAVSLALALLQMEDGEGVPSSGCSALCVCVCVRALCRLGRGGLCLKGSFFPIPLVTGRG